MRKIVRCSLCLISVFVVLILSVIIYYDNILPNNYYVTSGSTLEVSEIIETSSCSAEIYENNQSSVKKAQLKLLGLIPIKTVSIQEVSEPVLVPCGTPFGIKLLTDGVIVVEVSSFESSKGIKSPAYEAGIKTGDIIKTINSQKVKSNEEIAKIVSESKGTELEFIIIRNKKEIKVNIKPEFCTTDNSYHIGLWVRDSSAGIGTMTFLNPETGIFAGLGHPVCDVDTGEILPLLEGEIVNVNINGVKKGRSGYPGELLGSFISNASIGTLESNNINGLYGYMYDINVSNKSIPLAMKHEVKTGKAYIYTTVDGKKAEKYEITIEKIDLSEEENCKNMVIKVVDDRLLEQTGGIVQGMSGSPIIQNDKLVGAVTHVFVNNPTKGYAIFADTMYDCSLKVIKKECAA